MKVVVADAGLAEYRAEFEAGLPPEATVVWFPSPRDPGFPAAAADAEVIVAGSLPPTVPPSSGSLRLLQAPGAGIDWVDVDAWPDGVILANAYGHEQSIAEYIVASLVVLRRSLVRQDAELRQGRWYSPAHVPDLPQPRTLEGSVVTFLGFGHIGVAAWRLLRPFHTEAIAITRSGSVDPAANGLRWAGPVSRLDDALVESDILVVGAALSDETRGMIDARRLGLLGAGGLVVNVGRGPLIDEQDLYEALRSHSIGGAALDVWYRYPEADGHAEPSRLPFADLDNVLMTPHSSGITVQTFSDRARAIAANISRLARGEALENVVHDGRSRRRT